MTGRDEIAADVVALGPIGGRWLRVALAAGAAGLLAGVGIARLRPDGAERLFHAYLVNFAFFLSLALGALFFIMVTHLTRAGWSVVLRRLAEALAAPLLPLAILAIPVYLGRHALYEWTHASTVAGDALLLHKSAYLNESFFVARLVLYFVVWVLLSRYFLRRSVKQDSSSDPALSLEMENVSAPGLIAYALTLTFAAFDLLMALTPHWYSTIFGVYYFAGATVGFFATMTVLVFLVQRSGRLRHSVSVEHYHDLGKLTFGFIIFWAYIAFSQYMLIWYGNLPEETGWYYVRQQGSWVWMSLLLLFGHFAAPFVVLLSRHPKRRPVFLVVAAVWMLAMHWCDVYWLVMPALAPRNASLHAVDVATFVGIGGIFAAAVVQRLRRHALIPVGDPRLSESLGFENA